METINWGMIGCGSVTEKKNGPGLYKAKHSRLKAVFSRTYEKAVDYAQRHGVEKVCRSADELLSDPEINAIYIATTPESHKEYALACIAAGKIPYIEKPMALNYGECAEILSAAEKKNIPVFVAFYRRGSAKYLKIKELIDSGAIGAIRFVDIQQVLPPSPEDLNGSLSNWRVSSIQGGGHFLDRGVHMLDFLIFFLGGIEEISGVVENRGGYYAVEDTVSASIRFENGVVGTGLWCYAADYESDRVVISGEKGRLEFSCMDCGGDIHLISTNNDTVYHFDEPEHVGLDLIQSIVNELTGKGKTHADAQAAAQVTKLMDTLLGEYRKRYKP